MSPSKKQHESGMFTRTELSIQERWRRFVTRYAEKEGVDHRRQADRHYPGHGSVTLRFVESGQPVERTGTLQNFSEGGMMFKQYKEIEPQTMMQIELGIDEEEFTLIGRAVHCTQTLGGYKIGVEFKFDE